MAIKVNQAIPEELDLYIKKKENFQIIQTNRKK